jgi:signal transduction histidine kinase
VSETVNWSMVLVGSLFAGGVLWGVWRVGQWLLQRERTWSDALGAVMAATVLRRDRVQTLSTILERSIEVLGATSGALHLVRTDAKGYVLAHAVNVERLDQLTDVSDDDALALQVRSSREPVYWDAIPACSPWAALTGNRAGAVVALGLSRDGMFVLAWSASQIAERQLPALQAIQRYADQVLAEFGELEARAADIQALGETLREHEMLNRTAAHDLANKLTAVHSLLELAADSEQQAGEASDLVRQALEQVRLTLPLVEEFSNPLREIVVEPLQVEELVRLAAAMLERRKRDRTLDFTLAVEPGLPAVWGERAAVLRVLDNLLSNALKHNAQRPGLRVCLRVWAEGDEMVFEVGDNGAGIAEDRRSHLFEFGFHADSTGKAKGHGLGLWSSRRLVEALGGQIWAESEAGLGTRFCFSLPAVADRTIHEDLKQALEPVPNGDALW